MLGFIGKKDTTNLQPSTIIRDPKITISVQERSYGFTSLRGRSLLAWYAA